jgi:hypothetical protein
MTELEIGCCGAVCGTCQPYKNKICLGCKIGYATGNRDLSRAKCKIKLCCIRKSFATCADCSSLATCAIIQNWHGKKGYKYTKYKQAIEYIRENGYRDFIEIAGKWKGPYGKYH